MSILNVSGVKVQDLHRDEDFLVEDNSIQPIADELRKIFHVKPQAGVRGGKQYY